MNLLFIKCIQFYRDRLKVHVHPCNFFTTAPPFPQEKKTPKNDLYVFPNMVGFFHSYFWEPSDIAFQ